MAVVFKNPDLTDYFVDRADVRRGARGLAPIVEDYEAPKVVTFPAWKLEIDHDFWAGLDSDAYPGLKKLPSSAKPGDPTNDALLDRKLAEIGLPGDMEKALRRHMLALYEQVLPIYEQVFAGYGFTRRQVVWRLNTIRNENLHVDTYNQLFPEHFARLFINLDREPRIWQTSYTIEEIAARWDGALTGREADGGEVFIALNRAAFGGKSSIWWDNQPRHVAYFSPGDAWCVDSRQVAHQIFYGRRAVSFDFFVDPATMRRPERHYLAMAETLRQRAPAGA
jgi:hypothetical protein